MSLGKGKMTFPSGGSYDGDWIKGRFEGFGTYRFASGGSYIGEFKNGMEHGISNSSLNF